MTVDILVMIFVSSGSNAKDKQNTFFCLNCMAHLVHQYLFTLTKYVEIENLCSDLLIYLFCFILDVESLSALLNTDVACQAG